MKLYLSSYRIPDLPVLLGLVGKPAGKTTVALIPNAKDYYAPRARAVKIRGIREWLESLGFRVRVVDLNETRGAQLRTELEHADMIWAMGGNSFCLREAMQASGFDDLVKELLANGLVYAGESAGACVAGTDLKGIELADDDEFAGRVIWTGLRLTPHYIVPHADNRDFGPIAGAIIDQRKGDPSVVVLNDDQAWVVDGGTARKVTGIKHGEPAGTVTA